MVFFLPNKKTPSMMQLQSSQFGFSEIRWSVNQNYSSESVYNRKRSQSYSSDYSLAVVWSVGSLLWSELRGRGRRAMPWLLFLEWMHSDITLSWSLHKHRDSWVLENWALTWWDLIKWQCQKCWQILRAQPTLDSKGRKSVQEDQILENWSKSHESFFPHSRNST